MSATLPGPTGAPPVVHPLHAHQLAAALPQTQVATIDRLVRLDEVRHITGLGRSLIYAGMAAGTFPRNVQIARRSVAWRLSDVLGWCANPVVAPSQHDTKPGQAGEALHG